MYLFKFTKKKKKKKKKNCSNFLFIKYIYIKRFIRIRVHFQYRMIIYFWNKCQPLPTGYLSGYWVIIQHGMKLTQTNTHTK